MSSIRRCSYVRLRFLNSAANSASKTSWKRSLKRPRSEEHTSELQSPCNLVCRLLLEKKKNLDNVAFSSTRRALRLSHRSFALDYILCFTTPVSPRLTWQYALLPAVHPSTPLCLRLHV